MITFTESDHSYISIIPDDTAWLSVTTLIHALTEPFYPEEQSVKSSKNKKSKWYGMTPKDIQLAWIGENNRSTELGTWYHNKKEQELYDTADIQVYKPVITNGKKVASDQRLSDGIYPEHLIYLQSCGICGQSDIVEIRDNKLYIRDHKTNKEIVRKSYINWEGHSKKMLKPLHHLDDCNFNHYALQLSIYAFMILRHNPLLELGGLQIEHVTFETTGEDKYGYPITALDENKGPIVKGVEIIEVPYMKSEINTLITWLKTAANRNSIKKH